jgi:hypothetical protein
MSNATLCAELLQDNHNFVKQHDTQDCNLNMTALADVLRRGRKALCTNRRYNLSAHNSQLANHCVKQLFLHNINISFCQYENHDYLVFIFSCINRRVPWSSDKAENTSVLSGEILHTSNAKREVGMFTRRKVLLAVVPAALLLTGVVDGQHTAHAQDKVAAHVKEGVLPAEERAPDAFSGRPSRTVEEALARQDARTAAYREEAAQYRKKTEHYQDAKKREEEITRCGRFLLEHGGAKGPVTRENVCPMAREVAKDRGLAFPSPTS